MAKTSGVRVTAQGGIEEELIEQGSLGAEEFCDRQDVTKDLNHIVDRQLLAPPRFHFTVQYDLATLDQLFGLTASFDNAT